MEVEFIKMQGCGDDAVLMHAGRNLPMEGTLLPVLARRILDRSLGVGGNSMNLLIENTRRSVRLRSFDPEGTEGPPSFNALRCAAKYASDSGAVSENEFVVETAGGPVSAQIIDSGNVRVDLGVPLWQGGEQEIRESASASYTRDLLVEGRSLTYTPVCLRSCYAIIIVESFALAPRRMARAIARERHFTEETSVGFARVSNSDEIVARSWMRGREETTSDCGCAAAAVVAAAVNGLSDREVFVSLKGGTVFVQWQESDNRLLLTGPAVYVFTGTFDCETDS